MNEKCRVSSGKGQEKTHYDCQLAPVPIKCGAGQASTAMKGETQPGAKVLMEEVLPRENMLRVLRRVRSNKGAPGVMDQLLSAVHREDYF